MDMTWGAGLEVLSQQDFLIQRADSKSRIILANREMRSKEDKDLSHALTATITIFSSGDQLTRVMVAANQTTELHKNHIPGGTCSGLFPSFRRGRSTTVVVERDTVRSPQMYSDFFGAGKEAVGEKAESPQAMPPS
jgi:hypothetical protein